MPDLDVFPKLQSCARLGTRTIYDAKFYPYALDDDHIFAAVAETDAFVCRPRLGGDPPYDVLAFFRDSETYDGKPASYNSLAWTIDSTTGKPLLCIAGSKPKHIKIIDVESGEVVRILSGHGRGINDLAVSPLSTDLLCSCAEDGTIRLWNLTPEYAAQPCVAILSGEGHKQPILAVHFHPNGRWLLTGGIDTAIALWAVPSLEELQRTDLKDCEPKIVYYPHFFSQEVHSNYVDSIAFYGDLIISRAAKDQKTRSSTNEILIWRIDGFDSDDPPPLEPAIPSIGRKTRSSFAHDEDFRGFRRLVTLFMPDTDRFYLRFGLYHKPDQRPILAMGSQKSKFYFFDLQKLDEGTDVREETRPKRGRGRKYRGGASSRETVKHKMLIARESSERLSEPRRSEDGLADTPENSSTPVVPERILTLDDPFTMLKADHTVVANTKLSDRYFGSSQIAWSPDGTWMVGVGDFGMLCTFHRSRAAVYK